MQVGCHGVDQAVSEVGAAGTAVAARASELVAVNYQLEPLS